MAGGALVGSAAGSVAGGFYLALGVPTGGLETLACGVVVVGGAGYAGGTLGGEGGQSFGGVCWQFDLQRVE